MNRVLILIITTLLGIALVFGVWFFFLRPAPVTTPTTTDSGSAVSPSQTTVTPTTPTNGTQTTTTNSEQALQQKIFEVVDGSVAGATVVQTLRPTTTLARYVQQHNGHVFDLVLDSSGAVPKAVSNTTIPGVARVLWAKEGQAAILQYLDGNTTKTVYLGFPQQNASSTQPVTIKFLPDGIQDITVSPSGVSVAYLLRTGTGVRGYTAAADGTGSKELFTLPLKEVVLLWPSQNTLLAYTKSAHGVAGVSFSISASNGAVVPLMHAAGLTIAADSTYTHLLYQTSAGGSPATYLRNIKTGQGRSLSFDPYPERCVWGKNATSTLYCAGPVTYAAPNYLDLWHAGSAVATEGVFLLTSPEWHNLILAVPGGEHGGKESVIDTLSVSPDEKYLLFVRRGDRSLWGVRL